MVFVAAFRWKWLTGAPTECWCPDQRCWNAGAAKPRAVLFFVLALFAICAVAVYFVVTSSFGRTLIGIRENTLRMRAFGYNVRRYKLVAFVVAAIFGGVAGPPTRYSTSSLLPNPRTGPNLRWCW